MSDQHVGVDAPVEGHVLVVTIALVLVGCEHCTVCVQRVLAVHARSGHGRGLILGRCQHTSVFVLPIKTCRVSVNLADTCARLDIVGHVADHEVLGKELAGTLLKHIHDSLLLTEAFIAELLDDCVHF